MGACNGRNPETDGLIVPAQPDFSGDHLFELLDRADATDEFTTERGDDPAQTRVPPES